MPLFNHFRPPASKILPWTSLHAAWSTHIADDLNDRWLPDGFVANEQTYSSKNPEVDIATWENPRVMNRETGTNGPAATLTTPVTYVVPKPSGTAELSSTLLPTFEVKVFDDARTLVAAIELINPSNKDRPRERITFASKVMSYVMSGVSVVIVDAVCDMHFNLHDLVLDQLEIPEESRATVASPIYAAGYRPKRADDALHVDFWVEALAVGSVLPTMPLRLTGDLFVPVDLESTYVTTCRRRRMI